MVAFWVAMGLGSLLEWVFWLLMVNTKRTQLMRKQEAKHAHFHHTYSIDKAKGFQPKQKFEGGLKEAVEWSLK
jgi:hypothetical protein